MASKRSLKIIAAFLKIFKIPGLALDYNEKTRRLHKSKRKSKIFWCLVVSTLAQFSVFLYMTFYNRSDLKFDPETIFFRKVLSYCTGAIILVSITSGYTALSNRNRFVDLFNLWSGILRTDNQFWK